MDTVGKRIKALRLQLGMTQQAFADAIGGVTRGAVGNWERDQGIKTENLTAISERFAAPMDWLTKGAAGHTGEDNYIASQAGASFRRHLANDAMWAARARGEKIANLPRYPIRGATPIVGEVAAGAWKEREESDEPPQIGVSVNPDPRWAEHFQQAWIVRGRSVERTAKDGDVLIGVVLGDAPIQPQDGDLVIAERMREQGGLVERTAKRLRFTGGGRAELVPEYADSALNQPLALGENAEDDVRVVAVVVGVYKPLRRDT